MNDEQIRRLDGKLIPTDDWESAPENVRKVAQEHYEAGTTTGLAFDADWGWCVMLLTPVGPQLSYSQRGPDRQFLRAEEGTLKQMLADRDDGDILGNMSLQARLEKIQEELRR